jgi:hypothetical protein
VFYFVEYTLDQKESCYPVLLLYTVLCLFFKSKVGVFTTKDIGGVWRQVCCFAWRVGFTNQVLTLGKYSLV